MLAHSSGVGVRHAFAVEQVGMKNTAIQMRRLESVQGSLIKQSLGLSKLSHNTALLKALNIEKIEDIVNRNVLSLYNRIFKVESPARRLMQHLLSRFICYGETVRGTLLDRVVSMGEPLILNIYPKLVWQTMVVLLTRLDTFYLLIILPSHIHMNIF